MWNELICNVNRLNGWVELNLKCKNVRSNDQSTPSTTGRIISYRNSVNGNANKKKKRFEDFQFPFFSFPFSAH